MHPTVLFAKLRRAPDIWVLLAFSLLTLGFTYPLAFNVGTALPGLPPDTFLYIWNLEWTKRAIFELGANPYITQEIYFPTGVSLYFHTLILGNSFLALPLQFALGAASAYMLLTLVSFVLTGYGAYLLAYDCVKKRGPAFFAGLVFTFSPYHLAHLNFAHFNLITLQWLPFFALAAKKYLDKPSWKRLFLAGVFLSWISLTDWYYALYAVLFFGLLTLYYVIRTRSLYALLAAVGLGVVYLIFLSPVLVGMIRDLGGGAVDPLRATKEADRFSGDLLGFILPTTLHPLWGNLVRSLATRLHGGLAERSIFFGFIPLVLAIVAFVRYRDRQIYFWAAIALVFSLLALGPVLHVAGETEFGADKFEIILPQAILYQLPGVSTIFNIARSISRYSVIALMSISILAAAGLTALLSAMPRRRGAFLIFVACLGVGLEFVVTPIPVTPLTVPSIIETWRGTGAQFVTMDLPIDHKTGGEAMYYWTITGVPTTNGYHSQLLPFSLIQGIPSMREINQSDPRDIVLVPDLTADQVLRFYNIKYVVVHKLAAEDPELVRSSIEWVRRTLGARAPLAEDERVAVYAVPDVPLPSFVVMLDEARANSSQMGWDAVESFGDQTLWRWMRNDANIRIDSKESAAGTVSLNAASLVRPRQLQVFLNDTLISTESVSPDEISSFTWNVELQPGVNLVRLHSVEPPEQPSALGLNNDPRYLSIAFSELEVEPSSR